MRDLVFQGVGQRYDALRRYSLTHREYLVPRKSSASQFRNYITAALLHTSAPKLDQLETSILADTLKPATSTSEFDTWVFPTQPSAHAQTDKLITEHPSCNVKSVNGEDYHQLRESLTASPQQLRLSTSKKKDRRVRPARAHARGLYSDHRSG
jgi:hypothetical protein